MEPQEILSIVAQGIALLFIAWVMIVLVISQKNKDRLTGEEVAKDVIIIAFIFVMVFNGYREAGTSPIFDSTTMLLMLGSLLGLAGMDIMKIRQIQNGNRGKDSTDSK
jgi:hypothetical protein